MYLRRLKSFFTALFTIGRAVDRPCIDVFIMAIELVVAEILPFQSETIAKVGVYQ